jgi:hypothetical protein
MKCPIMCFAPDKKKISSALSESEVCTLVFLSTKEREKEKDKENDTVYIKRQKEREKKCGRLYF